MMSLAQVLLAAGMSVKKAAGAVKQALQKDSLRQQGFTWLDLEQYEHEVNALQRFLVDTAVSGGTQLPCCFQAWLNNNRSYATLGDL